MEKIPISPVSVVVFSMLSRGPGERSRAEVSFRLWYGRRSWEGGRSLERSLGLSWAW